MTASHRPGGRPAHVLLVEDSPSDAAMVAAALRGGPVAKEVHTVPDGEAAMAFLRRHPPYEGAPRPDIILLDLNLPRKDGREVLAEVKADRGLMAIPVVVLTSSSAESDIRRAYALHGNAYVTKPITFDALFATVQQLERFWLRLARRPGSRQAADRDR